MSKGDEPAFPISNFDDRSDYGGLTKREYFAAAAMSALASNPTYVSHAISLHGKGALGYPQSLSEDSVLLADKLIKQLEK